MSNSEPPPRVVVLAAVDDSQSGHAVVRVAANFARQTEGGELHLVHVVEDMALPRLGGRASAEARDPLAKPRRVAMDLAVEGQSVFTGRIVAHLAAGSAWKQVLQVAIDLQADVIFVGTHGRTGARRLAVGSVTEMIVRKASCPVVVVREKDYHALVPPEIEPACPDCLRAQAETYGKRLWCERHGQQSPHGHMYSELPHGFGGGAQLLRS